MRFMNWDVLLFPELGDTKTPLQEFRTICEVIQDPDGAKNGSVSTSLQPLHHTAMTRPVAAVSCFVPSLSHGCPFRVSMHSWSPPVASNATTAMSLDQSMIGFEVKVLLDGIYMAGTVFDVEHTWPRIIDSTTQSDEHGKLEQLTFPAFHDEMLHQTWVDPAQDIGRIKVVITEGIRQASGISAFKKTRTIVVFSFQHTPLHILQDTGIAWPNHAMYYRSSEHVYSPLSPRKTTEVDPDSHAHSPRHRSEIPNPYARTRIDANRSPPRMPHEAVGPNSSQRTLPQDLPGFSHSWYMNDPFVGTANSSNSHSWRSLTRNSSRSNDITMADQFTVSSGSRDQSMPDYTHSLSPATLSLRSHALPDYSRPVSPTSLRSELIADYSRPLSLVSSRQASEWEQALAGAGPLPRGALLHERDINDQGALSCLDSDEADLRDSQCNDSMALHGSRKALSSGTLAPANSRVSSAANTPPAGTQPSAAAKARASSYSGVPQRVVSVTVRDAAAPNACSATEKDHRYLSASRQSEIHEELTPKAQPVIKRKPSMNVKGKKEGRTSELSLGVPAPSQRRSSIASVQILEKENAKTNKVKSTKSGDSKRRRISNTLDSTVTLEAGSCHGSPILRKPSQDETGGDSPLKINDTDDLTAEGVVVRTPLEPLDNII